MPKRQKFRIPFYLATHGHRNPYALEQLRGAEIDFAVLPTLNHVKWKTNNKNGLEKYIFPVTCLCVNQKNTLVQGNTVPKKQRKTSSTVGEVLQAQAP